MNTRPLLIGGLVLVCLALATAWFLANFERRTESEHTGFHGKARRDQWLAAERLLQRMGAKAVSVRSLPELASLPTSATLMLPMGRQSLNPQSRRSLLNWVNHGGRLIVEAEPLYQPDPVLDMFGVQRKAVKAAEGAKKTAADIAGRKIVKIDLPPELEPVEALLGRYMDLQARNPIAHFGDDRATAALLLRFGSGHVLALNEFDVFSNRMISEHDHAEFLWRIVQMDSGMPSVFFFFDPKKLSLFDWLGANAWSALASGGLFLALWLWSAVPRLGPIAPDPERARRRLLDHLRASGRFLWVHGGAQLLIDAARDACLRRITRVHPDLIASAEPERSARLQELIGLDVEQSRRLFTQTAPARMIDFLQAIRLYQTVHERLSRGRPPMQDKKEMQ